MAGIYIHIPFCRKACIYCDFHFSTQLQHREEIVDALVREIQLRKEYLSNEQVNTIYFGGGTPSVLTSQQLEAIFLQINNHFTVDEDAEITLEANPDDLSPEKLRELADSPVNRLSIGIQSFDQEDLNWMNRSHSVEQSLSCVHDAHQSGFKNITIDLIYGIPGRDQSHWNKQLKKALELDVPHISAYALTVEKETVLENWIRKGKVVPLDESESFRQFTILSNKLKEHGYEHYEISNFAKPGSKSAHNSAYWSGKPYLGIGPSAHSFDGESRQWNISNNHLYLSAIKDDELPSEKEILSVADRYNEKVMTSLRKNDGLNMDEVDMEFGSEFTEFLMEESDALVKDGKLVIENGRVYIPDEHRFFSDGIASALFYI